MKQSGYTLVEMVITTAIFALAFVAITSIFIATTSAQNNAKANVAVLNESQLVFEQIAREIRSHAVDDDPTTCDCLDAQFICLKDLGDNRTFVRQRGTNAEIGHGQSCQTSSWSIMNDPNIVISSLEFYTSDDPTQQSFTTVFMTVSNNATGSRQRSLFFNTSISSRFYGPRNVQ